jgi:endoglucanase
MKRVLFLTCVLVSNSFGGIYVNQAGYRPSYPKFVFVDQAVDSFYVVDASGGATQFSSKFVLWKASDPASGMTTYRGDFTALTKTGSYLVRTSSGVKSPTFVIHDSVYVPVWKSSLKGFFFQRCGTSLPVQQAGVYYHPICHTLDGTFHVTAESSGTINSIGGWHDAGDYGKYVVNAGVTVGTLLLAYEMFPDRFAADDIGIPESGNRIPDILDETRVELEWLLTMQASSGGVFTKITHPLFEGFIMPQSDVGGRYIYRISSAATGDFAAMLARASRVYKAFDQQFSQRCLAAAVRAWQFLEKSPSIVPPGGFRNPTGTVTGEYGDGDDSDERLWAAAELLATTKETKYKTYYSLYYSRKGLLNKTMSWPDLTALAHLTYLTADFTGKDSTIMRDLKSSLQSFCQT